MFCQNYQISEEFRQSHSRALTIDERGVSRTDEVTLRDNIWKWWRKAPGFFQRYEAIIMDGGNTIVGKGELSKDGLSWEKDLDLTYTRVE